jgi:hypothetical protein
LLNPTTVGGVATDTAVAWNVPLLLRSAATRNLRIKARAIDRDAPWAPGHRPMLARTSTARRRSKLAGERHLRRFSTTAPKRNALPELLVLRCSRCSETKSSHSQPLTQRRPVRFTTRPLSTSPSGVSVMHWGSAGAAPHIAARFPSPAPVPHSPPPSPDRTAPWPDVPISAQQKAAPWLFS